MLIDSIIRELVRTSQRDISFLGDLISTDVDGAWIQENLPQEIPEGSYHRNLLSLGDDYELVLATWSVQSSTVIHDHGSNDSHGIFRVLKGQIRNRVYRLDGNDGVIFEKEILHPVDDSCEIHKGLIHSMGNPDEEEVAMTLHLYSPKIENVKFWNPATLQRLQR